MFSTGGEKPNIVIKSQGGTNLTLLVFVLGILSLTSIGIMTLSVVKQLRPTAFTAINKQLNYQGKLQDAGGITLADGNYSMKFSIYDDPTAGSRLWTECGTTGTPTSRTVAVANGVFSVMLGDTASAACPGPAGANAITLDFNSDSYYLGFTTESDSEMLPRKRLGASGYAFNADLLDGLNTSTAGGATSFVPATDASGNLVLTGNVTFDTPTFFLDSTNDNIGIGTITPDTARTLDLTTAKKYGIYSVSSAAINGVTAVYGSVTDVTNIDKYGGYFTAAGTSGRGVFGEASGTGDAFIPNYGGYFTAAGDYGNGVYGEATASGLGTVNIGGYFTSAGVNGYGVWAVASGTTGINYAGYFISNGLGGYAVKGWATDTNAATNYGGYFQASGTTGVAVYGLASGTVGINYGGNFQANGPGGYGVKGAASDISATSNYGGYFTAAGTSGSAIGVYCESSGAGTGYGAGKGALIGTGVGAAAGAVYDITK